MTWAWIGVLRTPESLRRSVADPSRHPDASTFSALEIDQLVAHLQTLRKMWAIESGERTREIAPATENAAFFDRPERDSEEKPDLFIRALAIPRGATVAERRVGGYFTWRLAEAVGATGKVFAVDVQPEMLDRTSAAVAARKLKNVKSMLATKPTRA